MKLKLVIFCLTLFQFGVCQQYDSVVKDKENIEANNKIYKIGNVFVYDYEIIIDNQKYKLKANKGMFSNSDFELIPLESDSIGIEKIHLLVRPISDEKRTNKNQTQISYLQEPIFSSYSSTGVVENETNVWVHPIRKGFFNALETAPFPFVKKPLIIGEKWKDQMKIGQGWGNKMWGKWKDQLLLDYSYEITDKTTIKTNIGDIDCYVIYSKAKSDIGTTILISYFSEQYGFVKLEYELLKNLKVNMWMVDFKSGKEFNDIKTFFKTKEYIKKQ